MIHTPASLVVGAENLSTVPLVFSRLNAAINTGRSSASHLGTIIGQDSALTARLLRVVNSAFFGFPRRIDTISRAVMVVGTQQLRDLAIATTIINSFDKIPSRHITLESFWQHSVACGIAARIIAGFGRQSNVEKFFVAGILHDIGRLIMFQKIPELSDTIFQKAESTGELMLRVEKEVLGFDHAAIGTALVRVWRLPASIEQVVALHHTPSAADTYEYEASVVHIADIVVHALQIGTSGERCVPPFDEKAWKKINLPLDTLPQIIDLVERQFEDVFTSLGTP